MTTSEGWTVVESIESHDGGSWILVVPPGTKIGDGGQGCIGWVMRDEEFFPPGGRNAQKALLRLGKILGGEELSTELKEPVKGRKTGGFRPPQGMGFGGQVLE